MSVIARRVDATLSQAGVQIIAVAGVLLVAAHLLPLPQNGSIAGLPTICPFKILSGYPCPGCGLTRAVAYAAHGDWAQALHFHPLGVVFYLGLWVALIAGVLALRFRLRPFPQRAALLAASTLAASLLVFWVVRLAGVLPYPPAF